MKKCIFFTFLLLSMPLAAQAEQVKFDLTFEDSSRSANIVIADGFKTIRRSNVSVGAIEDLQNEVSELRRTVDELQRRLETLEHRSN